MANPNQEQDFASVKARLDEIVQAVSDDSLPLDDALALYEEAVTLGLRVSDLLEEGIDPEAEAGEGAAEAPETAGGQLPNVAVEAVAPDAPVSESASND